MLASGEIQKLFMKEILKVQQIRGDMVACDPVDMWNTRNIKRSLRRGSENSTREDGVKASDIDIIK